MARALALAIIAAAAAFTTASGARYTVGEPRGSWDTQTNLTAWASSINFKTGDQLVFKYSTATHNVVEVTRSSYLSCSADKPMATYRTGNDAIQLGRALTRYFICGVPGHCAAGMKMEVKIAPSPTQTTCSRRRRQRRSYGNGIVCVRKNSPPTFVNNPSSSFAASVPLGRVISSVLVIMVFLMPGPMV